MYILWFNTLVLAFMLVIWARVLPYFKEEYLCTIAHLVGLITWLDVHLKKETGNLSWSIMS